MRATIHFKNSKILPCMIYAMLSLRQKLKNRKGYISGDKVKPETLKTIIKLPLLSILNKKRSQARENGWPVTLPASNLSHLSVPKLPKFVFYDQSHDYGHATSSTHLDFSFFVISYKMEGSLPPFQFSNGSKSITLWLNSWF